MNPIVKAEKRVKIKKRVRKKVYGTSERPRLSIFRSLRFIYAQVINDETGKTLCAVTSIGKTAETALKGKKKSEVSEWVGKALAEKAKDLGIKNVVFDRNGYRYHGRVKALADGARSAGLEF